MKIQANCTAPNQICTHVWCGCVKDGWICENLQIQKTEEKP